MVSRERQILISEPLPTPPHNSPGWYVGDQHMHSYYGRHFWENDIDTLEDMIDAADSSGLDWVIFTDHSFADGVDTEAEWEEGRDACTGNSTSSFKCLYGQEMSVGEPFGCDAWTNGHYLAHPNSDDDLGYIDGDCGVGDCFCRDEQTVIDEINNAGGIGFIAHPYLPEGEKYWGLDPTHHNWDDWSVAGFSGLEIINSDFTDDDEITINNPGGDDDSWVEFLDSETNPGSGFTVGIAGSDAHYTEDVGDTFTYCYLDSETLTTSAIRESYSEGHCVASTGPFVSFTVNNDDAIIGETANACASNKNIIHVNASSISEFGELSAVAIYTNEGELLNARSLDGYSDEKDIPITLDSENTYIRVVVWTDSQKYAYTNPIWLNIGTTDSDSDGYCSYIDCNDGNEDVNPGEVEACGNSIDDDCDGSIDEGCEPPEGVSDCTPDSCSGDYENNGVDCYQNGNYWTCERECFWEAHCDDDYGNWASENIQCLSKSSDSWCNTPSFSTNSDYCYQFYTETYTNAPLGSSISITASDYWDSETSSCTTSRPISTSTSTYDYGRGSGNSYSGSGKWTLCSGSLSSANFDVDFYHRISDWIDEDYDNQLCDVPYTYDISIDSTIYGDSDADCYIEVRGDESNPDEIKVKWYVNGDYAGSETCDSGECGDDSGSTWSNTFTLDSSEFQKGDEVYCIGRGYGEDGGHGAYVQSSVITVSNRVPILSSVSLDKESAMTGEQLIVNANGETDSDLDVLSMYCCNGASCTPSTSNHDFCYVVGDSPPYNLQCAGQAIGENGTQTVRCRTYDGDDYSSTYSDSYIINNTINITIISPELYETFEQEAQIAYFNISTSGSADSCVYNFPFPENSATNYSMTKLNDTYFYSINETMLDGDFVVKFYCNQSLTGEWIESEEDYFFGVDSVNVTRCRSMGVEGREYFLAKNITDVDSDCLQIFESNIIFNCNSGKVGGTGNYGPGLQFHDVVNVTIKNCFFTNWFGAIYATDSSFSLINSTLKDNTGLGLYAENTYNSIVDSVIFSNESHGIVNYYSRDLEVINSVIEKSSEYGIYFLSEYEYMATNNSFHNNFFNNTVNVNFTGDGIYENYWNSSKILSENILGGNYLGGNFWATPSGNGFSETCSNFDGDGICDDVYPLETGNIDYLPLTFNSNLSLPNDTSKFYHKNSLGENVAWLGSEGNIVLEGSCFSGSDCDNPGQDSFVLRNSSNGNVAFINSTGDLCIISGDCSDQSASCIPTRDAFRIKNSSNNDAIYVDFDGDLCLTGILYENSNP